MQPGDTIQITNGTHYKILRVEAVLRGRVVVAMPGVSAEIDLRDGQLKHLPAPRGVCAVDVTTGRIVGTSARVKSELLPRLEALEVGDILALDNCATAEVVDVLLSEGTIKIYVPYSDRLTSKSGVWLVGWRVSEQTLAVLRESAGVLSRAG